MKKPFVAPVLRHEASLAELTLQTLSQCITGCPI